MYILILGAGSDVAGELAKQYAKEGYNLYLAGRNQKELQKDARDLKIRYSINATALSFDAIQMDKHKSFYSKLREKPLGVICVFGYLGEQKKAETDFSESQKIIETNFTGVVSILNVAAEDMEVRKQGFIIGIGSVAGDRGRKSNYIYGASKGALCTYLSGLRNRLARSNVNVLTVKPGFIATKMTENMDLPGLLTAKPEEVARDIFMAQRKKRDIIYTSWFWKWIMLIIKLIPEKIFKKLNL